MAITRLGHIKDEKNKKAAVIRVLKYIANPDKSEGGSLVGTHNILIFSEDIIKTAANQIMETKIVNEKTEGRILYHYKISFAKDDKVTPMLAMRIAKEFCETYLKEYEAVYAVHTNTDHIHFHVAFNSVSFATGYKYRYEKDDWKKYLQPIVNSICKKYGLSEIDVNKKSETKDKGYSGWVSNHPEKKDQNIKEYSYSRIRADIDFCIKKANTYKEFIFLMESLGYKLDDTKKHLRIFAPERKKAVRSYMLTPDKETYTKTNIRRMINGTFKKNDRKEILEKMYKDWNVFVGSKRVAVIIRQ
ncbi:MAG: relaxase/mobilization nuclease domain-containing protein, partial [Lachnospiraceae bacterium]|nr:relaxase/mobilization nuclease domain-containing protein [Lachnospiraceae bacterium]